MVKKFYAYQSLNDNTGRERNDVFKKHSVDVGMEMDLSDKTIVFLHMSEPDVNKIKTPRFGWVIRYSGQQKKTRVEIDLEKKQVGVLSFETIKRRIGKFMAGLNGEPTIEDIYRLIGFNPELEGQLKKLHSEFWGETDSAALNKMLREFNIDNELLKTL